MSNPLFFVETGYGYANATSYIDTPFANTYLAAYGETGWTNQTLDAQQGALMLASQSLDLQYGQRYYSLPQTSGDPIPGLLFPRFTFVINRIQIIQAGTIPVQIQRATAEVALMYIQGLNIFPQPNKVRFHKGRSVKVGDAVSEQVTYARPPKAEEFANFWKVEQILYPILRKDENPSYLSL
jgi:hypothetical protein